MSSAFCLTADFSSALISCSLLAPANTLPPLGFLLVEVAGAGSLLVEVAGAGFLLVEASPDGSSVLCDDRGLSDGE